MNPLISILGCGWLGLPLAQYLMEHGYRIKGSTTTPNKLELLSESGIDPYLIQLSEKEIRGPIRPFLDASEILIITIPPGLRKDPSKNHLAELQLLLDCIKTHSVKHVIYISSISVFADETHFPRITDGILPNAKTAASGQIIAIEQLLQSMSMFKSTIIRFGGLIDEERHPGKIFSGRNELKNPKAPINLIHKTDCIRIIAKCIEKQVWGRTINAVYPWHPEKEQYYRNYCLEAGIPLPEFEHDTASTGKIVDSSGLERLLDYKFTVRP